MSLLYSSSSCRYRWLPGTVEGRAAKYIIGVLIGGGGGVLLAKFVIPFMFNHSEFLLPFALANGLTASFWYTVGEVTMGLDAMVGVAGAVGTAAGAAEALLAAQNPMFKVLRSLPVAGCVIGTLTALTTHYLWEPMINLCWGDDFKALILGNSGGDITWIRDLYVSSMYIVTIPISMIAGSSVNYLLKPLILGTPGIAWQSKSLPVLVGLLGANALYYTVCRGDENEWWWHVRMDPLTGKKVSHSFKTGMTEHDGGKLGQGSIEKRSWITLHHLVLYAWYDTKDFVLESVDTLLAFLDVPNPREVGNGSPAPTPSDASDAGAGAGKAAGNTTPGAAGAARQNVLIDPAATAVPSASTSTHYYSNKAVTMDGYNYPRVPRNIFKDSVQSLHASHDKDILYQLVDRLVRLKYLDLELQRVAVESENNISFEPDSVQIVEQRQKELDATKHNITEKRKAFITACNQELHLKDIATVLYAAEMGVCALNANILNTDIDTTSDESGLKKMIFIDEKSVLSDVRHKLDKQIDTSLLVNYTKKSHVDTETVDKTAYSLALLQHNFGTLQHEFHNQIGYDITQQRDVVQQVNSFQQTEKIRRAVLPVSLGVLGAVGALVGYMFLSRR